MQNQNRHLAAILFTDIVGYTALMQQNERLAVAMVKRYTEVLQMIVNSYSGKILNDYGDGSLCSFTSATEAVSCALKMQQELQKDPSVPLRIGLHIGEIFFEDKKVFGDGVNVASRIESLGQANSILFSGEINSKIKNNPGFKSVSLGHFEFKNVDDPVEVFALMSEGLVVPKKDEISGKLKAVEKKFPVKKLMSFIGFVLLILIAAIIYKNFSGKLIISSNDKTIAILPFKNISTNKEENEPFCIGVALELQKKLELLGGLIPIASQSVEKFRDTKLSVGDIAAELGGIKYILQGNVQRDKNRVKVFVSLVDVASNKELWSDNFPGEVEDIFSLQENIAQQIADNLQIKITPVEKNRIGRVASKNMAAIDAYNDALTSYVKLTTAIHPLYWDTLTSNPKFYAEFRKTLSLCDKVIAIDPSMAEAYVLKGQTYLFSIQNWNAQKIIIVQINDSITFYASKALEIDKSSADAYLLLSKRYRPYHLRDFETKDSTLFYLKKALAINGNSFEVNWKLGEYYIWRDPEKAIRFSKKAIRLNPVSLWTPYAYWDLGMAYLGFGEFEKAELYCKKAIDQSNNSIVTIEVARGLVINYLHWGKGDSAIKYASQYVTIEPNFYYEMAEAYCNLKNDCSKAVLLYEKLWQRYEHSNRHRFAVALLNIGRTKDAQEQIRLSIIEYKDKNDTFSYDYAGICALNGDKEKAMDVLRKWNWQWGSIYLIQHDKLFDNIRNEKEFKEIIQKALIEKTKLREKIRKLEERGEL